MTDAFDPGADPFAPDTAERMDRERPVTTGDYGQALKSGAYGIVSSLAGATQYVTGAEDDSLPGEVKQWANEGSQGAINEMTPRAREAFTSSFLPGEGQTGLFDSGTSTAQGLGLKATAALPTLISALIPGTLVARVAGAGAGALAASGIAGAQTGGDTFNDIESAIKGASPEEMNKSDV